MTFNMKHVAPVARQTAPSDYHIAEWAALVGTSLARFGTNTVRFFAWLMDTVQFTRMVQVLQQMNDSQLAAIGVKRSEISAYARNLITQNPSES
jgi:uncharacterized protein YjiS (DUF1127 family)